MNSTRVDVLVDTNVLVYTYATAEPDKRARALETLDSLVLHGRGRISTQVLGEVFRVVTAKLRPRRNPGDALGDITTLARAWPVLPITPLVVLEAARGGASSREPSRTRAASECRPGRPARAPAHGSIRVARPASRSTRGCRAPAARSPRAWSGADRQARA